MTGFIIILLIVFLISVILKFKIWEAMALTWLYAGLNILASANANLMINWQLVVAENRYQYYEYHKHC